MATALKQHRQSQIVGPGSKSHEKRNHLVNPSNAQKDMKISIKAFDKKFCSILYCPGCEEIFHDRNLPVRLSCQHKLCSNCTKTQLMGQLFNDDSANNSVKLTPVNVKCSTCQKTKTYQSMQELQDSISYDYEILIQVYKIRPKVAEKALHVYDYPDESQPFEILSVQRTAYSQEVKDKIQKEQKEIQQLNKVYQLQQRQQRFIQNLKEDLLCFKCLKHFDQGENMPYLLDQCKHKMCKQCFTADKDQSGKVLCHYCQQSRGAQEIEKNMLQWVIYQSQKKKNLLKQELEQISKLDNGQAISLSKFLSGKKGSDSQDNIKVPSKLKVGSGMLPQKQISTGKQSFDDVENFAQRRKTMKAAAMVPALRGPDDKEIACQFCTGVFNKLNRPILVQKCPCNQVHLTCEYCFSESCLSEEEMNEQPQFWLQCPVSGQKVLLEAKNQRSKQQVFEYFLQPAEFSQSQQHQCNHCFLKVLQNLLDYIYQNQYDEAIKAENDIINQEREDSQPGSVGDEAFPPVIPQQKSNLYQIAPQGLEVRHQSEDVIKDEFDDLRFISQNQGINVCRMSLYKPANYEVHRYCSHCNYDFALGERLPCIMKCNHNICKNCMEENYESTPKEEVEIEAVCFYDNTKTTFTKPSLYFQGVDIKENFANFWKLSVCVNSALLQILVRNKDGAQDQEKNEGDVEESVEEPPSPTTQPNHGIMYDIECPICMLCYSKENPPINLYCSEHQSRPFVLCKNEMIYYYMKSDKKKDMTINCPICHNDIKFKTAGKKEKEVMGLFEVNTQLLKSIENDQNIIDYIHNEETMFKCE